MESHLGGSSAYDGKQAVPDATVRQGSQVDVNEAQGYGDRPHGTVVNQSELHRRDGVDPTYMSGGSKDARAEMHSEIYASDDIKTAEGSNTRVHNSDLPQNDPFGHGQAGTGQIYSATELDVVDSQHATRTDMKPLAAGAYKLSNGNVLLVDQNNVRTVCSPQQWMTLQQRHQERLARNAGQPRGLLGAIANAVKRQ